MTTCTSFLNTWSRIFTNSWRTTRRASPSTKSRASCTKPYLASPTCTNTASSTETWSQRTCFAKVIPLKLQISVSQGKLDLDPPSQTTLAPGGTEPQKFYSGQPTTILPSIFSPAVPSWLSCTWWGPFSLAIMKLIKFTKLVLFWVAPPKPSGQRVISLQRKSDLLSLNSFLPPFNNWFPTPASLLLTWWRKWWFSIPKRESHPRRRWSTHTSKDLFCLINQVPYKGWQRTMGRVRTFSMQLTISTSPVQNLNTSSVRTSFPASQTLTKTVSTKIRQSLSFPNTCPTNPLWLGHGVESREVEVMKQIQDSPILEVRVLALASVQEVPTTKTSLINPFPNSINLALALAQAPTSPVTSQIIRVSRAVSAQVILNLNFSKNNRTCNSNYLQCQTSRLTARWCLVVEAQNTSSLVVDRALLAPANPL